ncbi:uncharacterized protein CLAFUR5_04230 [Fulvia fulva]|uniref:Uncharacterized protein n=1 Tax=Passalora fulva TaxID=5499 RepID=A0A9Q8P757_PASFU|nr:uncharacterized protein CLAFUR5_04230 [Fulvia fulva]KAK4627622.1 hypothetical protein CLAFUR0_04252 [Fulvia fulva]UJO15810.1 hypothetical protein CLAFUR5_04230 [Fulvia fulva]WPV28264.1 hypothetical protein CLAFUW7_04253 [Fulvia fulva]
MDGDHSAKTMDKGASAATKTQDLADGIHEDAKPTGTGAGEKMTGQGTSMLSKDGAIGGAFQGDGAIGSIGNKVGGPFAETGSIGKNFTAEGSIGGTAQKLAEKNEKH